MQQSYVNRQQKTVTKILKWKSDETQQKSRQIPAKYNGCV